MRKLEKWMLAAILICGTVVCLTSCKDDDEPYPVEEDVIATPAQLKKGIWTEFDEALVTSGKYTEDQVAQMPTVGMWIEGDKGYFFTYTAEVTSEAVEGQISYDNATGTGSIIFPTIQDSPLSDQIVSFFMTTDETMEFDFTYEGQKITGHCTWLCENLDNWSSDITDEDWKELMSLYEQIATTSGPDASIDWSQSVEVEVEGQNVTVENLDAPLVWNEDIAATRAGTRAIGVGTVISIGAKILGALFEEDKPDPNKVINDKLDAITGKLNVATEKLDQALLNQENMMNQMNVQFNKIEQHFDKVNARLIAISDKIDKSEAVKIFNDRNTQYYNKLKAQNPYFDKAYKLYNDNKDDLSKVSADLGELATLWVDKDNGEEFLKLTWGYIDYLSSVQHSKYGTSMAAIYDGLTFDKYPWEHMGTGDRQNYRSYDMFMITRCFFMINLYATYGVQSNYKKEAIYENYDTYKKKFQEFCEFKITNPDEFIVCQIPGAHFVMHKQIQKYYYKGKNNEAPNPEVHGPNAVYRPEWHQAGSVKIDNAYEVPAKLINCSEAEAIFNYFKSAVYPTRAFWWMQMLVAGDKSAGAVLAKQPEDVTAPPSSMKLLLYDPLYNKDDINGVERIDNALWIGPLAGISMDNKWQRSDHQMGFIETPQKGKMLWGNNGSQYSSHLSYYAAIVEKHY